MARSKRAQILMEPEEYRQLETIARERNVSVAELVREAVRERYLDGAERRKAAARAISEMHIDIDVDWDAIEQEIGEAHADGLS